MSATLHEYAVGDLVRAKGSTKSPRKISRLDCELKLADVLFYDGGGCSLEELHTTYEPFIPLFDAANPVTPKIIDNGVRVELNSSARPYVTVNGVDIPIVEDFEDMLNDLSECDGAMARMTFDTWELKVAMIAAEMVFKNARGSYGHTQEFIRLYPSILEKSREAKSIAKDMDWTPTPENIAKLPAPIREYIESLQSKVVN
jgi:hypothetical protein